LPKPPFVIWLSKPQSFSSFKIRFLIYFNL
jgi:hypothetical protein